ncbi:hypothetical protein PMI01_02944 [Caulobacter sp. AP07]|uniref:hypothetical protein n=1 Tax=Caulobacter sp. AP07 TaxID=1144304 RepID=UPI000271E3CA|nr:hypothetical protein [Caulobacter sp. AP07]EJL31009.1 hypothetical protein PMI01_02944 [Caulobacter sp. AP07]
MANFDPTTLEALRDAATAPPSPANWMASLWLHFDSKAGNPFGDIPLNQLPIPGSHDSGTSGMTRTAKTQGKSVAEQLNLGIRFFDLRPKVDNGVFKIHHGIGKTSEEGDRILARCDANGEPVADPTVECIFNDVRKFLIANPREIIILKFQTFGAQVGQTFTPQDHRDFRALMAGYMPLIAPAPVSALTLNNLYSQSQPGRVIVFYGDDLEAEDATWDPIWPFASGSAQREGGYRLECFDPWWRDDIGAFGGDDKDDEFAGRWLPYHIQNLKDWQADGLAGFFVTQAQMEIQPGATLDSCENSAIKNNPRNIEAFVGWMKTGVPGAAATLRPNILTLDYIEYGDLCGQIMDFFMSLTSETLGAAYPYHPFDLAVVRAALHRARPEDPTTALDVARPGQGYQLLIGHETQWVSKHAVCQVHRTQVGASVPVYRESPIGAPNTKFFYSTRSEAEANKSGWTRGPVAFYAYDHPAPGTVPIYADTPSSNPYASFDYTPQPTPAKDWKRCEVAFHAYPAASDRAVIYVYENKARGYFRFSPNANLAYGTDWTLRGAEFRALHASMPGILAVFEEQPTDTSAPNPLRYNYSTETADKAKGRDWTQHGVVFHAPGRADPGAVGVHLEVITPPYAQLYFSPRDASEIPAGWKRGDVVFYGYPYRYS